MLSSVFIKTYERDLCWLQWALKFLEKNWLEMSSFYIMAPADCHERILAFGSELNPGLIAMEEWEGAGSAYLGQQYFKMMSDVYCEGDLITFIDSDCMLIKPTTLEDLCDSRGRPIIWYTPHSVLGNTVPWKQIVAEVMLLEPEHEFMRCHPFTYRRETFAKCRQHLERLHGKSLHDIIRQRGPRGFTEFNVLGFFAYIFQRNEYDFRHSDTMGDWPRVRQYFSYGDWNDDTPIHLSKLLNPAVIEVKEPDDAQLFICTWERDVDWFEACFKSIKKYWRSRWTPVLVATPECRERLEQMIPSGEVMIRYENKMGDRHRGQVYLKMRADMYVSLDAEAILYTDSDCLFTRQSSYEDFCVDGRPIIHREAYDTLIPRSIPQDQNCFLHYRESIKLVLGIDPPAEYMRQHPFLYFKDTVKKTRDAIEKRCNRPLLRVMEDYGHSGYFSEFNCLGAYAAFHEPDRYHLADVDPAGERRVHQFHSWSQHPNTEPLVSEILNRNEMVKSNEGAGDLPAKRVRTRKNANTKPRKQPQRPSNKRGARTVSVTER